MNPCGPFLLFLTLLAIFTVGPSSVRAERDEEKLTLSTFRRAEGRREWRFPRDHGQHPAYLLEWWYYTGIVTSGKGRRFGYQVTFFRKGVAPRHQRPSAWAVRSLYLAHATLSDLSKGEFLSEGRAGRDALALAGAASDRHEVWLLPWRAAPLADDPHGVRLMVRAEAFSLELTLRAQGPPVLHGRGGLDQKGAEPGQASWYYSQPRLETTGWVERDGRRHEVRGTTWMDHEFGTNQLGEDQTGWDWFGLRLSDGTSLMLYRLRRQDGGIAPHSSGSLIGADGRTVLLQLGDGPNPVTLTPLRWWQSPASQARYPVAWRIVVPAENLELEITPELDNQELTAGRGVPFPYWEGAVRVTGTRGGIAISGEGYLELTGYAGGLRESFR